VTDVKKATRSLTGIAGIVAIATLISKLFGLVRQQAIAAIFGVGAAVDAYNYAYVIPGFLFVLLGGINGPFHSAIVSALAKRKQEDAAPLVETITTLVVSVLLVVSVGLIFFAEPLINLVAPGLDVTPTQAAARGISPEELKTLALTKDIAIQQFRIMAPMALLAGLIGIGFGTLNAANQYWLPSISPLFSSITVVGGLLLLAFQLGEKITDPGYALLGGMVLAWGTLVGAILQWVVQLAAQWKAGMGTMRPRFEFNRPGVKEVLSVLGPATFSSGMLQINVYTDLWFASFIPQAAAALGYAGLLVQTPLGIISNVLLMPMLPVFSRLAEPENWPELKIRIRQGIILTALTMLPLSALMVALATPIVRVVYERGAFDPEASNFVASVLIAYAIGMFVYLGRDVLVRVFYGLGDGETPFRISVANILLNAALDFLLVKAFGAPGLVLATVGVNLISMVAMLVLLDRRLNGIQWQEWIRPIGLLTGASIVTGVACWITFWITQQMLGTEGLLIQLLQLTIASIVGLGVFAFGAGWTKLPEVDLFVDRLLQKFGKGR
jgi:putative peptidoglycan lipid II flippase